MLAEPEFQEDHQLADRPDRRPSPAIRPASRLELAGMALLVLAALSSLLSVNTFPVVGNDSLLYIDHSRDLGGFGYVHLGYRQFGYPMFLAAVRGVAEIVGSEPLLTVAVAQRALLVVAGILAFWFWRWASLPLLVFLTAADTIGYTNFILTEGLALPLALLLVFPALVCIKAVRSESAGQSTLVVAMASMVALGSLFLIAMRLTFIVFVFLPLGLVAAAWKTSYRRVLLTIFGFFWIGVLGFLVAVSAENQTEYGVFSPAVGSEPTFYYYAWTHTFERNPANRTEPALAQYFDNGLRVDFIREMDASGLDYEARKPLYEREVASMLEAAGTSTRAARLESTLWALAGGRLDDIARPMNGVLRSTRHDVDRVMVPNLFASRNGLESFAERYNDSQIPKAVITDPIAKRLPLPSGPDLMTVMLPAALVLMTLGVFRPGLRLLALTGLLVVLATAVGTGHILADSYRLLVTASAFGLVVATAEAHQLVSIRR